MTRIDFYVLSCDNPHTHLLTVCKLAEKAFRHDQRIFIYSDDHATLASLDTLLWEFRADSFVPHTWLESTQPPSSTETEASAPVLLASSEPPLDRQLLINLSSTVPPFFSRFERTLEVVNQAPSIRDQGRDRYRFYQQRGYPLHHHKI